ncbi:hypothetical protein GCM10020001_058300 [Nonomuraea salmonea]
MISIGGGRSAQGIRRSSSPSCPATTTAAWSGRWPSWTRSPTRGAHALKLQTYTPDTLTVDCDAPAFRVGDEHELWGGETLYRLFERAHTPWQWHDPIFKRARERGLVAFSAPFDPTAVEVLEKLGVPAYKIASSEIVDLPLIRLAAGTGKPLIISTGMATAAEIDAAVTAARGAGCTQLVVLSCTATYPAPPGESNLRSLPLLSALTGEVVGLSDHTPGIGAALAAVALGGLRDREARDAVAGRRRRGRRLLTGARRAGGAGDGEQAGLGVAGRHRDRAAPVGARGPALPPVPSRRT